MTGVRRWRTSDDGGLSMMTTAHAPTELVADYAAGALSPGMRLLVGSHLSFCRACRDKVARLEAIGGALLAGAEAVKPTPRCLASALARIAHPETAEAVEAAPDAPLPAPLRLRLAMPVCDLTWRPLLPGLSECRLDGFPAEAVGLMRGQPGTRMLAPDHCGRESTLVLAGRLRDGARTYRRGDLALADPRIERCPEVAGRETCLCLVVKPAGAAPRPRRPRTSG
jgi:putative transcriptional regulator